MPKLRLGDTPTEMFTNWLGRKCRNHNPLSELKMTSTQRAGVPNLYRNKEAKQEQVFMVDDEQRNRLIYHNGETAFEILVHEIPMEDIEDLPALKVAH